MKPVDQDLLDIQDDAWESERYGEDMNSYIMDLASKVQGLRDAIRKHRDERGHDRCWLDDQALYQALPEATPGDLALPPKDEFIANCHRYWEHRQDPSVAFIRQDQVDKAREAAKRIEIANEDADLMAELRTR